MSGMQGKDRGIPPIDYKNQGISIQYYFHYCFQSVYYSCKVADSGPRENLHNKIQDYV